MNCTITQGKEHHACYDNELKKDSAEQYNETNFEGNLT